MKWVLIILAIILFALLAVYFTNPEAVEKLFSGEESAKLEKVEDSSITIDSAEETWVS